MNRRSTICKSMPRLELLIELLRKIGKWTDHVRIEIGYDGREFHWRVQQILQKDPAADDFKPKGTKRPVDSGG